MSAVETKDRVSGMKKEINGRGYPPFEWLESGDGLDDPSLYDQNFFNFQQRPKKI